MTRDRGICIARALVHTDNKYVPVFNVQLDPIVLYKETNLALLQPAEKVSQLSDQTNSSDLHISSVCNKKEIEDLFNRSCTNLDKEQQQRLAKLLHNHESVFASENELGRTNYERHRIYTNDHPPIRQRIRRVPYHQRSEVQNQIDDMLAKGIISSSESAWLSPVVLVHKKDGSLRFCIDYRKLNNITQKDAYPLPRIDDTLDALHGAQWFSTLDLASGYWQVEVDPADRPKTAFFSRYWSLRV